MKKKLLILPILAALLVACTGDELVVSENSGQETKEDGAIAFDAYLNRTVTRAGLVGGITTTELQSAGGGFGVFAYYTDGDIYSDNAIPNFMYNQEVKYNIDRWEYSPIKYWPNEFGTSAVSMGVDRVTFFAYAPYVGVDPSTGLLTDYYDDSYDDSEPARSPNTGITALTRNGKTGDPYVRYVGAFDPAKCVDLCYGVAAEKFISSLDAYDGANNINAGDPYINVAKPAVGSKLKFNFKHALVQLNVNVDADVDIVGHSESEGALEGNKGNTRVWVRSVTFDGVSQRGYLNMNTGVWYETIDNNKISHASVTVHDGRRDGAEALADDSYETPIGLNPELVQSEAYSTVLGTNGAGAPIYTTFTTTPTGVTRANQALFGETAHSLLVVPANEQLRVTIVYDVETADATLPKFLSDGVTRGSTVENKITKVITLGGDPLKLEAGKAYNISLHLGMTSVSFSATVSDWGAGGTSDVDLPKNGPQFAAVESASLTTYPVTVSAEAQTYQFTITGLNSGESVTGPADAGNFTGATSNAANTAGDAVESVSIAANNTVRNIAATDLTWTGGTSSKKVVLSIKQLAHKLGLKVGSDNTFTAGTTIALTSTASGIGSDWLAETTDATPVPGSITVLKNGSPMTKVDSSPSDLQFSYNATSGGITLGTEAAVGDIFTITLKTGDAPAETISVKAVAAP